MQSWRSGRWQPRQAWSNAGHFCSFSTFCAKDGAAPGRVSQPGGKARAGTTSWMQGVTACPGPHLGVDEHRAPRVDAVGLHPANVVQRLDVVHVDARLVPAGAGGAAAGVGPQAGTTRCRQRRCTQPCAGQRQAARHATGLSTVQVLCPPPHMYLRIWKTRPGQEAA